MQGAGPRDEKMVESIMERVFRTSKALSHIATRWTHAVANKT